MTRISITSFAFLAIFLMCGVCFADPPMDRSVAMPVVPPTAASPIETVTKSDSISPEGLAMTLFKDADGSKAYVTVEPDLEPGCKLRFTLKF